MHSFFSFDQSFDYKYADRRAVELTIDARITVGCLHLIHLWGVGVSPFLGPCLNAECFMHRVLLFHMLMED